MGTLAVFLIDRFGRRKLLIAGAIGMCIANAGLTGLQSHATNPTAAGCSLIFYFLALASYPIGLFLVPFMYAAEIAPNRLRPQITAMSSGSNWLFNFIIAEITPIAFDSISWRYYIVFICTNAVSVVVFYLFVPETKGRTLEDIDTIFHESRNALQPRRVARQYHSELTEDADESEQASTNAERMEKFQE